MRLLESQYEFVQSSKDRKEINLIFSESLVFVHLFCHAGPTRPRPQKQMPKPLAQTATERERTREVVVGQLITTAGIGDDRAVVAAVAVEIGNPLPIICHV